jgi:hypothetical protein
VLSQVETSPVLVGKCKVWSDLADLHRSMFTLSLGIYS